MASETLLRAVVLGAIVLFCHQGSEGAVTETTGSNRPPFSFACGSQVGGSAPTFCGAAAGDKKYVKVESVEIYRDYINDVGKCLEPEKGYIMALLADWFNYGCKIPNVERDDENKRMPVDYLKESMTKYCEVKNADVVRIVVNYDCVKNIVDGTVSITVTGRADTPTIPTRVPIVIVQDVSTRTASPTITTKSTSKASTSREPTSLAAAWTPSVGQPDDILSTSTVGKDDEAVATPSSGSSDIEIGSKVGLWIAIGFGLFIFLLIICGLLFVFCYWLPSRREKRRQGIPLEVGGQQISTLYLVTGKY